jgi:hypothetical protein
VHYRVAVEKVIYGKLAENSSRQDALQAIFLDWVDIFYHRIRGCFREKRVFQQPLAKSLIEEAHSTWTSSRHLGQ